MILLGPQFVLPRSQRESSAVLIFLCSCCWYRLNSYTTIRKKTRVGEKKTNQKAIKILEAASIHAARFHPYCRYRTEIA